MAWNTHTHTPILTKTKTSTYTDTHTHSHTLLTISTPFFRSFQGYLYFSFSQGLQLYSRFHLAIPLPRNDPWMQWNILTDAATL